MPEEDLAGQGGQKPSAVTVIRQQAGLQSSGTAAYQQIHVLLSNLILQALRKLHHLRKHSRQLQKPHLPGLEGLVWLIGGLQSMGSAAYPTTDMLLCNLNPQALRQLQEPAEAAQEGDENVSHCLKMQ